MVEDAAMIAELLLEKWKLLNYKLRSLREYVRDCITVRRMDAFQRGSNGMWTLEAHLAHWLELSQLIKPGRASVLKLLLKHAGPAEIAAGKMSSSR